MLPAVRVHLWGVVVTLLVLVGALPAAADALSAKVDATRGSALPIDAGLDAVFLDGVDVNRIPLPNWPIASSNSRKIACCCTNSAFQHGVSWKSTTTATYSPHGPSIPSG